VGFCGFLLKKESFLLIFLFFCFVKGVFITLLCIQKYRKEKWLKNKYSWNSCQISLIGTKMGKSQEK